jgi:hypothetical protein
MTTIKLSNTDELLIVPAEGKQNWKYLHPHHIGYSQHGTMYAFSANELPPEFYRDEKLDNSLTIKSKRYEAEVR